MAALATPVVPEAIPVGALPVRCDSPLGLRRMRALGGLLPSRIASLASLPRKSTMVWITIITPLQRLRAADGWRRRIAPWTPQLGGVPLAVVRSGDHPPHSRGRHRCRWATSRSRSCVAHPSAEVSPAGQGVRPRRSSGHPALPIAPDSSPWLLVGRGGCATARSSAWPDPCSLATSRRWVHRGLGAEEQWA